MYRHNPQTAKLVELVRGGEVGALRVVRAAFSFTLDDSANIRMAADLDGGGADGRRLLLRQRDSAARAASPKRVFGVSVERLGVDVVFAGTMSFADEVLAEFDCGFALPLRDELEAIGEEGSIFLDDPWHCRTPVLELASRRRRRPNRARGGRLVPAPVRQLRRRGPGRVVPAARSRGRPRPGARDGRALPCRRVQRGSRRGGLLSRPATRAARGSTVGASARAPGSPGRRSPTSRRRDVMPGWRRGRACGARPSTGVSSPRARPSAGGCSSASPRRTHRPG